MTYTVKLGDTLYGISRQFGVSTIDLANLNNVKAESLQVGMVLKIPTNAGTNPDSLITYTVKKGDSLYNVAKRYNTTVNDIIKLNNLKSNLLSIGQILRIPITTDTIVDIPEYINYTVKKGDTLYSIAKNNNTTVNDIIKDNNLINNNLSIGMNLKIRTDGNNILECFNDIDKEYIVKKGDTLYSIALNNNITVNELKTKNKLTSNNLYIGQKLII